MATTERKNTEEFIGEARVIMNDNGDFGLYVASTYFTAEHLKVFVEGKKIKLTTENLEAATFCIDCKGLCDYLDSEKRCHYCRPQEDPALYCADCYSRAAEGMKGNNNIIQTPIKALCTCGEEIAEWDNVKMCDECLDKINEQNKKKIEEKDPRGPYCPFGVTSQKIKDPKHPLHSLYKALCSKAQITGDLLSSCTAWETRDKCWTMFDDAQDAQDAQNEQKNPSICSNCRAKMTSDKEESWQCKNETCSINVIFKKI